MKNEPDIQFLKEFHITHGHPGVSKTINTLRKYKKLGTTTTKFIKNYIKTCNFCQKNKITNWKYGILSGHVVTKIPLQDISSDIFNPFNSNDFISNFTSEKLYIITFTDRASRFSKICFVEKINSKILLKCFKRKWIAIFGKPKTFLSDNGKCYISEKILDFCKKYGIKKIFTSEYNPTGNSLSERINSGIKKILLIYKGWKINLIK